MPKDTHRKLSAILFADIEGYTTMMQEDEAYARQRLDKFHFTLQTHVADHNGQVINNYGDGCVCTFDSAVDAMNCAKEAQHVFRKEPIVPVRMGLHSGDVFFEKDNVYGDSVNIASRIESLGVAGAVLFSKRIKRDIANQTDFEVQSLGEFEFKNVEKIMEVFALANEGLVIPKQEQMKGKLKQAPKVSALPKNLIWGLLVIAVMSIGAWWFLQGQHIGSQSINNITSKEILPTEIRDRNVAVMIFEDETNDESLNAIGKMISDWISSGLMEINKGKVISATHVRDNIAYASVGGGAQPSFAEQTGAEVLVQGRYYKVENNVFIKGNIINALDGTIIKSMKVVSGNKGDIMSLIDDFTQQILGFWATSKSDRYKKRPPKFEAYQAYLIARENWTANDALAEQKLKESYSLDSTYMEPLLKLLVLYDNNYRYSELKPLIQKIESLDPEFTEYESLHFSAIKADYEGDLKMKTEMYESLAELDQEILFLAGFSNYNRFKCQRALEYFKQYNAIPDGNESFWDQIGELFQGLCMFDLGLHEELEHYMDSLDFNVVNDGYAGMRLINLVKLEDWSRFDSLLLKYHDIYFTWAPAVGYACNYMYIHDVPQLSEYLDDYKNAKDNYSKNCKIPLINDIQYNHLSDHDEANIAIVENIPSFYYLKAVYLVENGKNNEAEQVMIKGESLDREMFSPGTIEYNRAIYHSALKDNDQAMFYLQKAVEAGKQNDFMQYGLSVGLKDLHGYPPFEEFIKPKS